MTIFSGSLPALHFAHSSGHMGTQVLAFFSVYWRVLADLETSITTGILISSCDERVRIDSGMLNIAFQQVIISFSYLITSLLGQQSISNHDHAACYASGKEILRNHR